MSSRTIEIPGVDAGRLRRDNAAFTAVRALVRELRERSWTAEIGPHVPDSPGRPVLVRFARGEIVDRDQLATAFGCEPLEALERVGAVTVDRELAVFGLSMWFANGVVVVVPRAQDTDRQMVYIGREAPWLIRVAWRVGPPSGTAADLATGTGVVAAVLSARYERVVAADISPVAVECAALTLALNESPLSQTRACIADIAAGLAPGRFDLVVANPPWVPSYDETLSANYLYADGGPTGMELPARFIEQARDLLNPSGVGVIAVCDTTWSDGRRPLDEQVALLEGGGFEATIEPAPPHIWEPRFEQALLAARPDCRAGRLVALVFRARS